MLSLISVAIVIFVVLRSLEENVVYFFSPTEIYNKTNISFNKKIRVGGLVKMKHRLILLLLISKKKLLYLIMAWFQIYFLKEKALLLKAN